jgi:hypothetical protein
MIVKSIVLDVWQNRREQITVQQGENGSRYLRIYLQNAGQPVDLTDAQVTMFCTKPDGTTIFSVCPLEDGAAGIVRLPITAQMCTVPGELRDIEIRAWTTDGSILKIYGLYIRVTDTREYTELVESDDEFSALQEAMAAYAASEGHRQRSDNPHRVTAAQIGAAGANEVAVLKSRMDAFTVLPDGSTAGDAELKDIRIGYDGTAYNTAADAVRGQAASLDSRTGLLERMTARPLEILESISCENSSVTGNAGMDETGAVHVQYHKTGAGRFAVRQYAGAYSAMEGEAFRICLKNTGETPLRHLEMVLSAYPDGQHAEATVTAGPIELAAGAWTATTLTVPSGDLLWAGHDVYLLFVDEAEQYGPGNVGRDNHLQYFAAPMSDPFRQPMALWTSHALTAETLANFDPADYCTGAELNRRIGGGYITCWGDDLTAQGGWPDALARWSGLPVCSAATGGEPSWTIAARQGADVMVVNRITIPADKTPVRVATYRDGIPTQLGKIARPLLQGDSDHVNPVCIGDVEGTLIWTGKHAADTSGIWTFTRSVPGAEVTLNRPTVIRTYADRVKNAPHLMVLCMGQNDGAFGNNTLIRRHRQMIAHANARHVLVLGLPTGTAAQRAEYESAMTEEFGRYFINLRAYLSAYGLADAGLTPTAEDTIAMGEGRVPPQLLTDGVHFTEACAEVIGEMLYEKCGELGIF